MPNSNKTCTFTKEEQEAMRARAKELKSEAKAMKNREEGEKIYFKLYLRCPIRTRYLLPESMNRLKA